MQKGHVQSFRLLLKIPNAWRYPIGAIQSALSETIISGLVLSISKTLRCRSMQATGNYLM